MIRIFIILIGLCLAVAGGISLLAYLNLLRTGYHFLSYLQFIIVRIEFYLFVFGSLLTIGALSHQTKEKRK
ncbi:hypothetical protein [Bacillus solitudinis]|uniref:hypothetical protein n=1 Tax=Bacillus solitudinis TaxID=2014074 RepID=UPI000C236867|nr:hypothetical protein [Bacillus solitudinis]